MIYVSSSCLKNKYIVETVRQLAEHGIKNIELSGGTEYYDDLENDLKKAAANIWTKLYMPCLFSTS